MAPWRSRQKPINNAALPPGARSPLVNEVTGMNEKPERTLLKGRMFLGMKPFRRRAGIAPSRFARPGEACFHEAA